MRSIALAVLLFAALHASAVQTLYLGTAGEDDVDLVLDVRDDCTITGATWWPKAETPHIWHEPLTTLRLVTGSCEGKTLRLFEWSGPMGPERSRIEARFTGEGLRGTWREHGRAPRAFEAFPAHRNDSALFAGGGPIGDPSDRLHDAIRAGNWPVASYYAQLLCAVTSYYCSGWSEAIPQAAAGTDATGDATKPWYGLQLEPKGRFLQAAAVYREQCQARQHTSCAFLADLVPRLPPEQRRSAHELTCDIALIGCEHVFGAAETALTAAAHRGDVGKVVSLLREPVNVNAGKAPFHTPLFAAVEAGSLEVVIVLLARGADPNLDGGYMLPIDWAVLNGTDAMAMTLLEHGANGTPAQAMWHAAYKRKLPLVRKMLENGERPDDNVVPAGSPLTAAVKNGDVEMVRLLLAHGADPKLTTNHSAGSPIDYARKGGNRHISRMLEQARERREAGAP